MRATVVVHDGAIVEALSEFAADARTARRRGRLRFPAIADRVVNRAAEYQSAHADLQFCCSVKTNPDRALLMRMRSAGFYAEVISPSDFEHAQPRRCNRWGGLRRVRRKHVV